MNKENEIKLSDSNARGAAGSERLLRAEERTGDGAVYRYSLTVRESDRVASFGLPLYSVAVEMAGADGISAQKAEDCFSDERKANGFFSMLVDHLATPIDLPYILEDERQAGRGAEG